MQHAVPPNRAFAMLCAPRILADTCCVGLRETQTEYKGSVLTSLRLREWRC